MTELSKLRNDFGMNTALMLKIMNVVAEAMENDPERKTDEAWNSLGDYLNILEQEIISLRHHVGELDERAQRDAEHVSRLKVKNGNYRLGMKQLQKAHEALLHRYNTLKGTVDYRYQEEKRQAALYQQSAIAYGIDATRRIADQYVSLYGSQPGDSAFDSRAASVNKVPTRL